MVKIAHIFEPMSPILYVLGLSSSKRPFASASSGGASWLDHDNLSTQIIAVSPSSMQPSSKKRTITT